MAFIVDINEFIADLDADVAANRIANGFPALVPNGHILLGREQLKHQHSAPRIVLVPTDDEYGAAKRSGMFEPLTSKENPAIWYLRGEGFDAHIWGDPDPAGIDPNYGFNSARELCRQFIGALVRNAGGTSRGSWEPLSGRWEQPTDDLRSGRLYVFTFRVYTAVTNEPYIVLPFSTATASGVQIHATEEMVFPDGSSTIAGVIIGPP